MNNFFEFNSKVKEQVSGIAVSTKFAPLYACLFMYKFEISFLEPQQLQPLAWFRYIGNTFFTWTHGEEKLNKFLKGLTELDPRIKLFCKSNIESITFLDTRVSLRNGKDFTNSYVKPTDSHQYLLYWSVHSCHTRKSVASSQTQRIGCVVPRRILKIIRRK